MDKIQADQIQLPQTMEECHHLIRELMRVVSNISHQLEKLTQENQALKEQLNLNSANSSFPPSQDYRKKKVKKKPPSSGRSSGGQPGHPGHFRPLLDASKVDQVVYCQLPERCFCGGKIETGEEVHRHQVYELPILKLHVTEYQLAKGFCQHCQQAHTAELPEGISWGMTGARLTSFMSSLVAQYHLSRREVQAFLKEHFDFSMSLGTVFNKQKLVNTILESPVKALLPAIKAEPLVHVDETGHRQDGHAAWMWIMTTAKAAYYEIVPSRGSKVFKSWMWDFQGIICSDRYSVYNYFPSHHRQLCWSHLKRDFTRISEKKDRVVSRIGEALLSHESQLFTKWHQLKDQHITRDEFIRQCEPIRRRVGDCLEQCTYTDPQFKVVRLARNLLENFHAMWTFVFEEGIAPTNNHAEQCLRPWVIWRKKYFGTRSVYGAEYVGRSASWLMTCRLQSRSAFDYLTQAVRNHFCHTPPPPLIEHLSH